MRFIADGPSIPDELITAHDQGRVILFCGSGVSRARAKLPDFMGLAASVLDAIDSAPESPARKVKEAAENAPNIDGLGSLIAADTIFSQLEDEFPLDLIQKHVARALHKPNADLAAHRMLLDLARGPDGRIRLVTTNFDLMFEESEPTIATHAAPDLPDPARADIFQGIIHLHGMVTADYEGAECRVGHERGFVLSAADFGGAYLVHGWAAQFIQKLIAEYHIVFVGYSADDPPVRYLLEALSGNPAGDRRLYAFQEGDDDHARALWRRKGVEAICYDPADGHRALWDTLAAWAERARDPEAWHGRLLDEAAAGPRGMPPHRRGQIAHLAATKEGARRLAHAADAIPAEWLCVFDPHCRYMSPPRSLLDDARTFDPFDRWSLDSDAAPEHKPDDPEGHKRETPTEAWNAFAATARDRHELGDAGGSFFGNAHQQRNRLPPRLIKLADWFAKVAHQPIALWWVSGMIGLNPDIAWEIKRQLSVDAERFPDPVRQAWATLLDVRAQELAFPHRMPLYDIAEAVKHDGWRPMRVRDFAAKQIPERQIRRSPYVAEPPEQLEHWRDLFNCDLDYAWYQGLPEVLDEHIALYARQLLHSLETAIDLEREFLGYVPELGAFTPDSGDAENSAELANLTALFRRWIAAMERWARIDADAVRAIVATLAGRSEKLAIRARLWACCQPDLFDAGAIGRMLVELDDESFWDYDHQRDLLHTMARNWATLPAEPRHLLESRLLSGPPRHEGEADDDFAHRSAWRTLIRIGWLAKQGCAFDFDVTDETRRRSNLLPDWNPAHVKEADRSNESRAYSIVTDKDTTTLAQAPLNGIIETARASAGRDVVDWRKERDPFAGLVDERPARALAALRRYTGPTPTSYWSSLLWSERRKDDPLRLTAAIAATLSELPDDALAEILNCVTWWFRYAHEVLEVRHAGLCARLWDRLLGIMEGHPEATRSGLVRRRDDRDWIGAALNAPAGRLTELALLRSGPTSAGAQIADIWLERMLRLLSLPEDAGSHALVFLARHIDYLFARAPAWTKTYLLPIRHGNNERRVIFWIARFWNNHGLSTELFTELRDDLLALVNERRAGREWNMQLAGQILLGWHREEQLATGVGYSDAELRTALLAGNDEFRRQILHTLRGWIAEPAWIDATLKIIADIWPRQASVRSADTIAALVNLLLASGENFPDLTAASLDLLEPLQRDRHWQLSPHQTSEIAAAHPDVILTLLTKILSTDPSQWPYGMDELFSTISKSGFHDDARLLRLQKLLADWK
ncbi:MAG: SIR2 family protein [Novosphingobium sp.]